MSKLSKHRFDELVATYREYRAFDESHSPATVRAALTRIARAMQDAAQCIAEMSTGGVDIVDETAARAAWRQINILLAVQAERPLIMGDAVAGILTTWAVAANQAHDIVPQKRFARTAIHMLADKLVAYRVHEQMPCTSTINGPAVADVISIARAAGDKSVTRNAARDAVKAALKRARERAEKLAV